MKNWKNPGVEGVVLLVLLKTVQEADGPYHTRRDMCRLSVGGIVVVCQSVSQSMGGEWPRKFIEHWID